MDVIHKFVDDINIQCIVGNEEGRVRLQHNISERLETCAEKIREGHRQ